MQTSRENQPTFFDLAIEQRTTANRVLDIISREVDFGPAEARVASTYSQGGRPAFRVGILLRVMILQHLYGLSDPKAEEQIKDRLSFQKFIQLDAHESVPDETTICRFRQRLIESGLIRTAVLRTAKVQDGHVFEAVAPAESQAIYADKIYDTKRVRAWMAQRGIANNVLKKGARHIKLSEQDHQNNRVKSRVRTNIERIFAHLKQWQNYRRVRYLGLAKNQLELTLKAVAYNLKGLARILELKSA